MARQVSGRIRIEIDLQERNTAIGTGAAIASMPHAAVYELNVASGTADGQMDRAHSDDLTLTTTPTDVDLAGSLSSDIGAGTSTFVEVSMIYIENNGLVDINVGGDANALAAFGAAADYLLVKPGGRLLLIAPAGYAVTAGTGDILQLAAASGTCACKYIIGGRSA